MDQEPSFEQAIAELDATLAALNTGDMTLEDSIDAYKRGLDLALYCRKKLNDAQGTLTVLQGEFEQAFSLTEE